MAWLLQSNDGRGVEKQRRGAAIRGSGGDLRGKVKEMQRTVT